ncbi:hypothetical protein [Flavobacterium sp. IMCC34518]|uniref:hypothetical protein n=1 Tax=Flavobacterium sp. IMCC34518 TaxID=3003623 RepID=UPI0022AC8750|nr:hypothetical protein [Flavobacterium sp. IMCC34518]
MNIPCYLIPALVGLISGILGYLIGKASGNNDEDKNTTLQAELNACQSNTQKLKTKITNLEAELNKLHADSTAKIQSFAATTTSLPFDSNLAFTIFGKKIIEDDLKIIEGIGPKIEELFQQNGIKTWKLLSETSVDKCQSILDSGGERFVVHSPSTWPKQAEMAYLGKWKELKEWQDNLKGGK